MPSTSSVLHSLFSFRTGSATAFASLFYFAIFTSLYITQSGPPLPTVETQRALGLNLEHAYKDLHLVSSLTRHVYVTFVISPSFQIDRKASSPLQLSSKSSRSQRLVGTITRNSQRPKFYSHRG